MTSNAQEQEKLQEAGEQTRQPEHLKPAQGEVLDSSADFNEQKQHEDLTERVRRQRADKPSATTDQLGFRPELTDGEEQLIAGWQKGKPSDQEKPARAEELIQIGGRFYPADKVTAMSNDVATDATPVEEQPKSKLERQRTSIEHLQQNPIVGMPKGDVGWIPLEQTHKPHDLLAQITSNEASSAETELKLRHDHVVVDSGKRETRPILRETLTQPGIALLKYMGKSLEEFEAIRSEINKHGMPLVPALEAAMKDNDVLMVGESHREPKNPLRELAPELLPKLHKAGATHLALEMQEKYQPALDAFNKTGKVTSELTQALSESGLHLPKDQSPPHYLDMLRAAHKAGFEIVAVDLNSGTGTDRGSASMMNDRNAHMEERMSAILNQHEDNKIVFWCGSEHLWDTPKYDQSVPEILGQEHKVCATKGIYRTDGSALNILTPDLEEPIAVDTQKATKLGELPATFMDPYSAPENKWDLILLFPNKKK